MICKSIEMYTLRYLENKSGEQEKRRFKKHLSVCGKCRRMFRLIQANYHAEEKVLEIDLPLSEKIGDIIDKSRYPDRSACSKPVSFKKVFVISIVSVFLIFTAANAKTIYKTYKELTKAMFIDQKLLNISSIKHTGIYSDKNYVESIYKKYEEAVGAQIGQMETAENVKLSFVEDGNCFKVQIAKGLKGNFITYGFEGYTVFHNEFYDDYALSRAESIINGRIQYTSIEELLDTAGIAPMPGYIPEDYHLEYAYQTASGKGRTIPENLGLSYRNNDGESLNISLTRSKMTAGNIGIPDELVNAAGLAGPKADPDAVNEETVTGIMEEMKIGEYQAVYTEKPVNSTVRDGTCKIFKTINIYLGDDAKLPILRIDSASLDQKTLVKVASQVEISDISENRIETAGYFRGIIDTNVLTYTDRFLEKIKAGETEFRFQIDEDTEFYRLSHNDTYYILYRKVDLNQYRSMVPLNIHLNEHLFEKVEYASVQILGWPYSEEKSYSLNFIHKNNTSIGISMDRPTRLLDDMDLTDHIIGSMSGIKNEVKPLFSRSGHLYYLTDTGPRSWILNTMYEDNGMARSCTFFIDKTILNSMEEVMDFIHSLHP